MSHNRHSGGNCILGFPRYVLINSVVVTVAYDLPLPLLQRLTPSEQAS
jgi:hypothetical protein